MEIQANQFMENREAEQPTMCEQTTGWIICTQDGFPLGVAAVVFFSLGILTYLAGTIFAFINIFKFYKHRSFPLGMFYLLMIIDFGMRMSYYLLSFFYRESIYNLFIISLTPSISSSIGMCQIMNYVVLYHRLRSYEKLRHHRDQDFIDETQIAI